MYTGYGDWWPVVCMANELRVPEIALCHCDAFDCRRLI